MNIHAVNDFLSYEFGCWLEIAAFSWIMVKFVFHVLDKEFERRFAFMQPQGVCAATLAPIFEEPEPVQPQAKKSVPAATLSGLIRHEVEKSGIRELRQLVRDRNLQAHIKASTGKSVARCTVEELRSCLG